MGQITGILKDLYNFIKKAINFFDKGMRLVVLIFIAFIFSLIKIFPPIAVVNIQNWADCNFSELWTGIFSFIFDGILIISIVALLAIIPKKTAKKTKQFKKYIGVAKKYNGLSMGAKLLLKKFKEDGYFFRVDNNTPHAQELFGSGFVFTTPPDNRYFVPTDIWDSIDILIEKDKTLK